MQGRRRLILLAAIIVAVAMGAVGLTIVSLFEASMAETRDRLALRVDELAAGVHPAGNSASLVQDGGEWRVVVGKALPPSVQQALPAQVRTLGRLQWLNASGQLVAVRAIDNQALVLAWVPLADIRAPFQRAAIYAVLGIALLLAVGLWLFYRMTAPLLRNMVRSESRYRALFANTAEGVLLIGEGIEDCNDRFCEMFGCRRSDVIGLPWREMFMRLRMGDGSDVATLDALLATAMHGEGTTFTWSIGQPDSSTQVIDISVRPLGEQTSRGPRVLVSLRDVTARENAARELRVAEQALQESREKLARSGNSSALVELAAGIAHEINQPLTAIANYARASQRLLMGGKPTTDVAGSLDRIAEQAQRAGDAIQRIRSLVDTTPDRGICTASVSRLIQEVIDVMHDEIRRHEAQVELIANTDASVYADAAQIQQVVMHLLRNALEAVGELPVGERHVRIDTRICGDSVEVGIEDGGCGLAPEVQARMFEPFYTTKARAMGMGLPISVSIIRSHHGELAVDAARERGTRIGFRLPMDQRAGNRVATARVTSQV